MTRREPQNWLLTGFYWAFVAYLLVPLLLMMAMSFKDANFISFPIQSWTLKWYGEVLASKQFLDAVMYSIMIAFVTTAIATVIGVWIALLASNEKVPFRAAIFALACLPVVVPGMIQAISMRIFIRLIDMPTGTTAIILGHTVHAVPFVVIMAMTRLRSMPKSLTDAARDLGADNFIAFIRVTLPYLGPALVGGMIFCVLTSIDDFVRTFFLGGYELTLPMLIFAKLSSGMSPDINAIATLVLIVTAVVGLYAERLSGRSRN
ncbi:ABC transporter permease [Martelella alba]|uniref:ABC transporter permease n=1 Tax=Martelella alba TaxID=2590451 RepID=A0A506U959_9HYPH|nr:ABC transporter permease [Martelella alba]TPW29119.1 ABC transporter permease [Martelella alba]